ncbi:MAG: DegT/DnrJ/EryC1/StrS family aminotransferase [Desulfobulbaceae bacterium]|nr:DegT/DnrJ/EryC1/StrS family aminotransferase [Desulfobulbaceae bacterium]
MRIGRTLPPAASPITSIDFLRGIAAIFQGQQRIKRFDEEVKRYFDVPHCFLLSSGKAALTIILRSLHDLYPERYEVVIPAYNCYSVPSAITRAGLTVTPCDIDPQTLDFNFDHLSSLFLSNRKKILAVVPAHFFGLPSDIPRLRKISPDPEITIIEDAAQAMGGATGGKKLGTLGDAGFYSLGRGKAFSTVEGGIIITGNTELAGRIRQYYSQVQDYDLAETGKLIINALLLVFFQHPLFFWFPKGLPFLNLGETIYDPDFKIKKLSPFQAGLAAAWQEKLAAFMRQRNKKTGMMEELLDGGIFLDAAGTSKASLIRLPIVVHDLEKRKRILAESNRLGLGVMPTYPAPVNCIDELQYLHAEREFTAAREMCEKIITLPVHPFVTGKDVHKITSIVNANEKI